MHLKTILRRASRGPPGPHLASLPFSVLISPAVPILGVHREARLSRECILSAPAGSSSPPRCLHPCRSAQLLPLRPQCLPPVSFCAAREQRSLRLIAGLQAARGGLSTLSCLSQHRLPGAHVATLVTCSCRGQNILQFVCSLSISNDNNNCSNTSSKL